MPDVARTAAVVMCLALLAGAGPATAAPAAPDLSRFPAVAVDAYVDGSEVYFQTPDGLLCAIRPVQGLAGCDGLLPGVPAGVNQVALSADQSQRGLRTTTGPLFVKPSGVAAKSLPAGRKIGFADFACAVADGSTTLCTKGTPPDQWLVIGPSGTSVGPRTAGLPPGFPDPNESVAGDESYLVGIGAKNLFPVFTVGDGLMCKMAMFSGGVVACGTVSSQPLPGVNNGDDEVFAQMPGPVGTRRSETPRFTAPEYPGFVRQLLPGHRIDSFGATCMATDEGVACFGAAGGPPQGFAVSHTATTTFGGSP